MYTMFACSCHCMHACPDLPTAILKLSVCSLNILMVNLRLCQVFETAQEITLAFEVSAFEAGWCEHMDLVFVRLFGLIMINKI